MSAFLIFSLFFPATLMILAKLFMVEQATVLNTVKAYGLLLLFICLYGLVMMSLRLFVKLDFAISSFAIISWLPAAFVSTPAIMMSYKISFIKSLLIYIASFFISAVVVALFIYFFDIPRTWMMHNSSMQSESNKSSFQGADGTSSILDD